MSSTMTSKTYEWQAVRSLPQELPIAQLRTVHLSKLLDGDAAESRNLLNACKTNGFFYLNTQNIEDNILQVVDAMFQLDRELYDLSNEEKMAYDVDKLSKLKLNGTTWWETSVMRIPIPSPQKSSRMRSNRGY